jgi:hypothetical protein
MSGDPGIFDGAGVGDGMAVGVGETGVADGVAIACDTIVASIASTVWVAAGFSTVSTTVGTGGVQAGSNPEIGRAHV